MILVGAVSCFDLVWLDYKEIDLWFTFGKEISWIQCTNQKLDFIPQRNWYRILDSALQESWAIGSDVDTDSSSHYLAFCCCLSEMQVNRNHTTALFFPRNLYLGCDFSLSFYINSGEEKESTYICKKKK